MSYTIPRRVKVRRPGPHCGQEGTVTSVVHDIYRSDPAVDWYYVRLDSGRMMGGLASQFEAIDPVVTVLDPEDVPPK